MQALLNWLSGFFNGFWNGYKPFLMKALGFITSVWGLILIVGTLIWTVLSHIIPILSLLLDTLNGLVTGDWNLAPPASIVNVLAIGNTFCPLQEAMQFSTAYGILKASQALFRWIKALIPTEAGS